MVDNQHRHITGYRELGEADITAMNDFKALEKEVLAAFETLRELPSQYDQRAVSVAITEAQTAFMWAVRAIARPGG